MNEKSDETLRRMQTAESVFLPISREAFEKLYLNPKSPTVSGDLRKKVGNPTPISLLGFLLASTTNACIVMGWRGAGGNGAAIMYEDPLSRLEKTLTVIKSCPDFLRRNGSDIRWDWGMDHWQHILMRALLHLRYACPY